MTYAPKTRRAPANRDPYDFFTEPQAASAALFDRSTAPGLWFDRRGMVYDPCRGSGNILLSATEAGFARAAGNDLHPGRAHLLPVDFRSFNRDVRFALHDARRPFYVVSNPPYLRAKGTVAFIEHFRPLVQDATISGLFVFVDARFLFSGSRHAFFKFKHPPAFVALLSDRPSCSPGQALLDGQIEAKGGSQSYCWLGWMPSAPNAMPPCHGTRLLWLRDPEKVAGPTP